METWKGAPSAKSPELRGFLPLFTEVAYVYSKERENTMANSDDNSGAKLNLYIKFLKERLAFDPNSATLHYNLGIAYSHKSFIAEAISEFKQSIECDPNLAEAYVNLGGLYAETEPARSIEANIKALKINPDLGAAHSNLAFGYLQSGQTEKAIEHGKRALELMPDSVKAYQILSAAYLESGSPKAVAELSIKMLEANESFAAAHHNLAIALRIIGRDREADEHSRRAEELGYKPI